MVTCNWVQENLTAWIDRELSEPEGAAVGHHVRHCARCATESEELRRAVDLQRRCLGQVMAAGAVETHTLWRRVYSSVAEDAPARPLWAALRWPFAITSAALAAAALLMVLTARSPRALFVSVGIESPPTAVAREPELFKDYPLIEQLDALEHFDTVESVPLDDEPASENG